MASLATVTIPARIVPSVLGSLAALHDAATEALALTGEGAAPDPERTDALRFHRDELDDLEHAIRELREALEPRPRDATVVARRGLLREALSATCLAAAEGVVDACRDYEDCGLELDGLRAAVGLLAASFELFAAWEVTDAI